LALKRIKINLATFSYRKKGLEYGLLALLCAALVSNSIYLIYLARMYQGEVISYSEKIARLERTVQRKGKAKAPRPLTIGKEDLKQLEARVAFVRQLMLKDIFPWDMVLGAIERDVPKGVFLEKVSTSKGIEKLTLQGRAKSMGDISVFLNNLDLDDIFYENRLVKFSVGGGLKEDGNPEIIQHIHFDIECKMSRKIIMAKLRARAAKHAALPRKGEAKRE